VQPTAGTAAWVKTFDTHRQRGWWVSPTLRVLLVYSLPRFVPLPVSGFAPVFEALLLMPPLREPELGLGACGTMVENRITTLPVVGFWVTPLGDLPPRDLSSLAIHYNSIQHQQPRNDLGEARDHRPPKMHPHFLDLVFVIRKIPLPIFHVVPNETLPTSGLPQRYDHFLSFK
jgi:hypothetical protein